MKTLQLKKISKRLGVWALIVTALLLIPFLGRFPWTMSDFVFAGVVLFGCAASYELITGNMKNKRQRIAVAVAVLTILLLIWAWAVA